jgi:ADP-ribosylglycohydrolase
MRILPLAYYHKTLDFPVLLERVHQVSCITHAHPRSQMACGIYISIIIALLEGSNPQAAYREGLDRIEPFYQSYPYNIKSNCGKLADFSTGFPQKLFYQLRNLNKLTTNI